MGGIEPPQLQANRHGAELSRNVLAQCEDGGNHEESMTTSLPTLISKALIAFTIELDNRFEQQLLAGLDFKTWQAQRREVFLVSVPMWWNYLRHLPEGGLPVGRLAALAHNDEAAIKSCLNGLRRWRYVTVQPEGAPGAKPRFVDWIVRPTRSGLRCQALWRPLLAEVEQRWTDRFGAAAIDTLQAALMALIERNAAAQECALPVISSRREMFSRVGPGAAIKRQVADLPLYAQLSEVLLAFTLDFEARSPLALPICANALRVLDETGARLRDLPARTGTSKPAVAQSLTLLKRHHLALVEPDPAARRGQRVRLTRAGTVAQANAERHLRTVVDEWCSRFGRTAIEGLRAALAAVVGSGDPAIAPLSIGLRPPPGNWRSYLPAPTLLPHHPILLGRGAWPDAS